MEKETNNRMEALACIIADLKAENMMMTERVHQLTDDYNDVARKLRGMEKRKDEDPSKQTLGEMMQMRDHCDKLERENKELKRFAKKIHSFVTTKTFIWKRARTAFIVTVAAQTYALYTVWNANRAWVLLKTTV